MIKAKHGGWLPGFKHVVLLLMLFSFLILLGYEFNSTSSVKVTPLRNTQKSSPGWLIRNISSAYEHDDDNEIDAPAVHTYVDAKHDVIFNSYPSRCSISADIGSYWELHGVKLYKSQRVRRFNGTKHHSHLKSLPVSAISPEQCDVTATDPSGDASSWTRLQFRESTVKETIVSIVMGITSKKLLKNLSNDTFRGVVNTFPLIRSLLPSFCQTANAGYLYRYYLAFDYNDPFFNNGYYAGRFQEMFAEIVLKYCGETKVELKLLQCQHAGAPAWAQNDGSVQAYLDGTDYIYRVNDDMLMISKDWTRQFIDALRHMQPANVGITGPSGGRKDIFTFEFVHRTHIDIFGFYYPPEFPDWFCDGWISNVYNTTSVKRRLTDIRVKHMENLGQRYSLKSRKLRNMKPSITERERRILWRYVSHVKGAPQKQVSSTLFNGVTVIITTAATSDTLWTILRSAQYLRITMPHLTMAIIIKQATCDNLGSLDLRILAQISHLDAEIYVVSTDVKLVELSVSGQSKDGQSVCSSPVLSADHVISDSDIHHLSEPL